MTKKTLYIVGTKTLADMIVELAQRSGYTVAGFFDDTSKQKTCMGKPVIGPISLCLKNASRYAKAAFAVAIGDNSGRETVCTKLFTAGLDLPAIIDPKATVMPSSIVGAGSLLFAQSYVGTNTRIGNGNILFPGVVITHHSSVGDYNFFAPGVSVGGHTQVASYAKFGMNSVIAPHSVIPNNYSCPPLTYVNK
jgi:sugar O-acyltransferase (sialic acid O-acetyltransferase NeuD family)